jgi:hypothetical protein
MSLQFCTLELRWVGYDKFLTCPKGVFAIVIEKSAQSLFNCLKISSVKLKIVYYFLIQSPTKSQDTGKI